MVTGQKKPGHVPPGHLPPDIYPPGHLPPGQNIEHVRICFAGLHTDSASEKRYCISSDKQCSMQAMLQTSHVSSRQYFKQPMSIARSVSGKIFYFFLIIIKSSTGVPSVFLTVTDTVSIVVHL